MAESCVCWGHEERAARGNKIRKLFESHLQNPDENMRVLVKRGPVSVSSLKRRTG